LSVAKGCLPRIDMDNRDNNGERASPPSIESENNRRDDTPSFIRNVENRAHLLNPQRESFSKIPVLAMPKSMKIWLAVRWPLFVFIVVVVLATVGMVTHDLLVARSVERTIAEAEKLEMLGTVAQLRAAGQTLMSLAQRHEDRANVQAAWAWLAILQAVMHGPEREFTQKAKAALGLAGNERSSFGWAARAGIKYLEGKFDQALDLALKGLGEHPGDRRIELARAWSLRGMGRTDEAREVLAEAMQSSGTYVPLFVEGVFLEIVEKNKDNASALVEKLLSISPAHLYGSLVKISLALPDWAAGDLNPDQMALAVGDVNAIGQVLEAAPPKLADFGHVIEGRVYLSAGDFEKARAAFSAVVTSNPDPKLLAWYALAMQRQHHPEDALELLDKHPEAQGAEIFDIRSQSLLDCHRVESAAKTIDGLEATGEYPKRVSEMRWALAVRKGDNAAALAGMPDKIDAQHQWLAVELYWLLKESGDSEGVARLTEAMDPELSLCADAIRAWHVDEPQKALSALKTEEKTDACVDVLAVKLLNGYVKPSELKMRADRAKSAYGLNLLFEIDRARAIWLTDGHGAATEILDDILKMHPEGSPLKRAISQAYIDLDLPDRALEILDGDENSESMALRIYAARAAGNKILAADLVKAATKQNAKAFHPALLYFAVQDFLRAGKYYDVLDNVEPVISKTAHWTSEIVELGAKAYDIKGDRTDADRLLYRTSKQICASSGLDESWQTLIAQIRLNLRRGGKFMYRAIYLLSVLKEEGVENTDTLYNWAIANIKDGNDRAGVRYLREALELDPAFKPAYSKLASMEKLDDELTAMMKRTRPGWSPEHPGLAGGE
jgi:tetratricopeptide (TPR) repeat protein